MSGRPWMWAGEQRSPAHHPLEFRSALRKPRTRLAHWEINDPRVMYRECRGPMLEESYLLD